MIIIDDFKEFSIDSYGLLNEEVKFKLKGICKNDLKLRLGII